MQLAARAWKDEPENFPDIESRIKAVKHFRNDRWSKCVDGFDTMKSKVTGWMAQLMSMRVVASLGSISHL